MNWVLPFFAPGIPRPSRALTHDDQIAMLDAAVKAAPKDKSPAGADYIFLMLFGFRCWAITHGSPATGAMWGSSSRTATAVLNYLGFLQAEV